MKAPQGERQLHQVVAGGDDQDMEGDQQRQAAPGLGLGEHEHHGILFREG